MISPHLCCQGATHPVFPCLQTPSTGARSTLHEMVAFAKGGPTKNHILMTSRLLSYCRMQHSKRHLISVEHPPTVKTRNRGASPSTQLCAGRDVHFKPGYAVRCFLLSLLIVISMVGYFPHWHDKQIKGNYSQEFNFLTQIRPKQNSWHFQTSFSNAFLIYSFLSTIPKSPVNNNHPWFR